MTRLEIIEEKKVEMREKLEVAEEVLAMAYENQRKHPSRANRLALQAATRMMKESMAVAQEWADQ